MASIQTESLPARESCAALQGSSYELIGLSDFCENPHSAANHSDHVSACSHESGFLVATGVDQGKCECILLQLHIGSAVLQVDHLMNLSGASKSQKQTPSVCSVSNTAAAAACCAATRTALVDLHAVPALPAAQLSADLEVGG